MCVWDYALRCLIKVDSHAILDIYFYLSTLYLSMKAKHNERKKEKKLLAGRSKIKSIVKTKKHGCKTKSMFHKDINPVDTQNISLTDEPACSFTKKSAMQQSCFKRKIKKSSDKGSTSESSSNLQCKTTDSMEWDISENRKMDDWKINCSDEEIQGDTNYNRIQSILPKKKRNIGSPCVIEMLSDGITSLNLPEILHFEQTTNSDKETFCGIDTFESDALPNEKDTCVIIAKSVNPRCHTRTNTNHGQQASPVLLSMNKNNEDTSSNKLKDVNDTSNFDRKQKPSRVRNKKRKQKSKNLKNCNNDAEAHSSSQYKDVNTLQQENVSLPQNEYISVFRQENVSTIQQESVNLPQNDYISTLRQENVSTIQQENVGLPQNEYISTLQQENVSAIQQENISLPRNEYLGALRQENVSAIQQENVGTIQQKNISTPQHQIINESQLENLNISSHFREILRASHHTCNKKLPQIYCIRNIVIVIMEKESGFCFTGKLLVKVLYGAVKIYGYILNNSTDAVKVYSPRGYNHVAMETTEVSSEGSIEDIWTTLTSKGITRDSKSKLQIDINNVQPGMAVLALENFDNNLTLFLKTYFPHFRLFPTVKNPHYYPWTDPRRAEIILQANLYFEQHDEFKYKRLLYYPDTIDEIAERMLSRWYENEWSCTMIMGGKSVGKSTNVRYLINYLLRTTKVVLVDVDPGQAECTPASCISYSLIEEPLMGPNFTHLKMPVYQLFLDEVNIAPCVLRYLESIKMLIERLKGCPVLSRLPIVVNTMGFVQNLGWDIAIFTIKLIKPSIILQIRSSKKNNYKEPLSATTINKQECTWTFCDEKFLDWNRPCKYNLYEIPSQADILRQILKNRRDEGMWNMEPYQQRELVMMSYLSDIIREDSYHMRLPISINETVPYMTPFSSLCIIPKRLFGVPPSHALSVINGNIVALCGVDLEESSQESNSISSLRVLTQRSPLCTCYGFGIIRGVDMEQQKVFINTPLPTSVMQYVNCLAGCIPVPPTLLQLHYRAPYVGGNAGLPTSRESKRRVFRVKTHKKKVE